MELIKTGQASYYFNTNKIDTEIKNKGEALAEQHFEDGSSIKKDLFGDDVKKSAGYDFSFRCYSGTRLSKDKKKFLQIKQVFPPSPLKKSYTYIPRSLLLRMQISSTVLLKNLQILMFQVC